MERHRCARCRNPIRRGPGVSAPGALDGTWFHPDCWAAVMAKKQEEYHRRIQAEGIDALIAPYVLATPAGARVVELVVAQAQAPEIEAMSPQGPPGEGAS